MRHASSETHDVHVSLHRRLTELFSCAVLKCAFCCFLMGGSQGTPYRGGEDRHLLWVGLRITRQGAFCRMYSQRCVMRFGAMAEPRHITQSATSANSATRSVCHAWCKHLGLLGQAVHLAQCCSPRLPGEWGVIARAHGRACASWQRCKQAGRI